MPTDRHEPVAPPKRDLSFMGANPLAKVASEGAGDRKPASTPRADAAASSAEPERRRPASRPRKPVTGDPYAKVQRTAHIPLHLHDLVTSTAKAQNVRHGRIVLDAIAMSHKDLPRLVQQDRAGEIVPGDLWDEVVPQRQAVTGPKKALNFQVTNQQAAVIDELITQCDATDRTHLLTVALTAYFKEA